MREMNRLTKPPSKIADSIIAKTTKTQKHGKQRAPQTARMASVCTLKRINGDNADTKSNRTQPKADAATTAQSTRAHITIIIQRRRHSKPHDTRTRATFADVATTGAAAAEVWTAKQHTQHTRVNLINTTATCTSTAHNRLPRQVLRAME